MSDKRFDDIIRSKLADFESQDSVEGWDNLKSRIKTDEAHFDDKIKNTLKNHAPAMPVGAWNQLYNKYQRQKYLRNQVIAIKSGELLILLLCFFTFFNYTSLFDFSKGNNALAQNIDQFDEAENEGFLTASDLLLEHNQSTAISKAIPNSPIKSIDNNDSEENFIIQKGLQAPSNIEALVQTESLINIEAHSSIANQNDYSNVGGSTPEVLSPTEVESESTDSDTGSTSASTASSIITVNNVEAVPEYNRPSSISALALLSNQLFILGAYDRSLPELIIQHENESTKWSRSFHFYTSINNYSILSPRDEIYNVDEQVLYTPGFSVNALYGFSKNSLDILTGLTYSRISYEPYPIQETYQSEEGINIISLKKIQYDIISLPVVLRKHFIQTEDWSLFGGLGLQAGLVINEYYGIDDRLDVPIPRPESVRGDAKYRSKLSEKEFTRAVFNGGKFSENVFLHGSVHGGVERNLNAKTSLYLSFEYARHLVSPLGPNNDKINIFSFGTGVRVKLN
ncbi:MAG: hypothetical protein HKN09_04365 [Saprospiraceae bacterium]|nr:hypothetical protein [Saprospiraceae bacterium]